MTRASRRSGSRSTDRALLPAPPALPPVAIHVCAGQYRLITVDNQLGARVGVRSPLPPA